MTTKNQQQMLEQQQAQMLRVKNSGMINHVGSPLMNEDKDEEMTRSSIKSFPFPDQIYQQDIHSDLL
ncbi:UNVERIFIED_CONTAM: hypothetical protein Sradi_0408600 [Sesamum radiatum]|uniref:Uncharacterized protein n=1 Tax=Sesamum radiatum TaxID=300843 RepID=A0AAW2W554_SESRA